MCCENFRTSVIRRHDLKDYRLVPGTVAAPSLLVERGIDDRRTALRLIARLPYQPAFHQGSQLRKAGFHSLGEHLTVIETFAAHGNRKRPWSGAIELLCQGKNSRRRALMGMNGKRLRSHGFAGELSGPAALASVTVSAPRRRRRAAARTGGSR